MLDAAAIAKSTYVQTSTTFTMYAFNCTNALLVQTTGAVPIVAQVGPYTYTKTVNKYEVGLTNGGTTVQYKSWTQYTMAVRTVM